MEDKVISITYVMTLFVAGGNIRSVRAIANVRAFCDAELFEDYTLEVVDLCVSPQRARDDQLVAAPTLVRHNPLPARRIVGDMSDYGRMQDVLKVA